MTQPPQGPPPGYPAGPPQHGPHNAPTQSFPPQGPPPGGHGGPPPFGPGPYPGPPAAPRSRTATAVWVLGLISIAATVVGLSVKEDGRNGWDTVNAWGALAILGAVLTLAPVIRSSLGLTAQRAWQVAACGAAALGLFWVLFVLPAAGSNTSLATTVGAAAGIIAVWIAPGREQVGGPPGPMW